MELFDFKTMLIIRRKLESQVVVGAVIIICHLCHLCHLCMSIISHHLHIHHDRHDHHDDDHNPHNHDRHISEVAEVQPLGEIPQKEPSLRLSPTNQICSAFPGPGGHHCNNKRCSKTAILHFLKLLAPSGALIAIPTY